MANATDPRSTALTELVRILRDQLQQKDERIGRLEELLGEASMKLAERESEIVRLEIEAARTAGMQAGAVAATMAAAAHQPFPVQARVPQQVAAAPPMTLTPPAAAPPAAVTPAPPAAKSVLPPPAAKPKPEPPRVGPLPRKGPRVDEVAASIFAAASEREPAGADGVGSAPVAASVAWPATLPVVQRVVASVPHRVATDETAKTLRLDRDALANGHKRHAAQQGIRKILPWGGRAARAKQP